MKKIVLCVLLVFTLVAGLVLTFPQPGWCDAGDFSGGSDFGGSDWGGSDSGSDWGGSDWGGSDWDDDHSSSGGGFSVLPFFIGGNSGSGGGGNLMGIICIVLVVIIVITLIRNRKNAGQHSPQNLPHGGMSSMQGLQNEDEIIADLIAKDPNFTKAAFVEKVSNMYIQMQHAWQDKAWEPMRMHMTDALYSQMERQLEDYKRNGRTNIMERIAVLGVRIIGYSNDAVNDILTLRVNTRLVDYTVDDNTGAVISGSKTAEKFMEYEYTYIRSTDQVTPTQEEEVKVLNCKNCGAPLQVNHSGQCPYCDSVITASEYDWVLSSIKAISQQTVGK
ncbi:MAG: Tim44 domain-containing protein [Clostridia bacterium]|nr:Tim44 domain-containing protein [Clostridia bacterium]